MNVRLALVGEGNEILDMADWIPAAEWNAARDSGMGAFALVHELRGIEES